jgi:molybdate transport system substrate-binding protein
MISLGIAFAGSLSAAEAPRPLLVYAAASLTNALDEIGNAYTGASGQRVKFSYASSSTLAHQIEAGAEADVFLSADEEWMDYLATRDLINATTRVDLLTNTLVLVAPADSTVRLTIAPGFGLLTALGNGRLSIGDPESVPAGKYARSALMAFGVWDALEGNLVRADNVRAALAFVDRGEAPLGIVYGTDALVDKKVRIVDTFPGNSHPPIVYPIAATMSARVGADRFIAFAKGPRGQAAFTRFGFGVIK